MSIKKGTVTIASSTPATEWGSIEGTLADQQDLKNALDSKIPYLSPALTGTPTAPTAQVGTNTNQIATTKFVKSEIEDALQNVDLLPDQTGNNGKYLRTDGAVASWEKVDALPDQTGQSGKVLTTNGTTASWTEYSPTPDVDGETIHLNSSDELEVIGTIEKNAGDVKYDWVGTYAEWEAGRNNNTIPDDWVCYITDDFISSTVTHNIGDIFYSLRTEDMFNGAVACDGSQYDIANYSEGTKSLKSLLDAGKLPYVSIQTFDATVTANGSCRCFGYDSSEATIFKVPKLNDVFIETGVAANNSEFIEAGLPNITGETRIYTEYNLNNTEFVSRNKGAFYYDMSNDSTTAMGTSTNMATGTNDTIRQIPFDASRSNPVYGNSDTVQPNAVKYRAFIQLANASSESALQTVSTVVNDVNDLKEEMPKTLKYKNITNCITEISQDIKLELNSGILTLKAGSKVYVPNGFEVDGTTPKFDVVTISSDVAVSSPWIGPAEVCLTYRADSNELTFADVLRFTSGSTAPTETVVRYWYDTTNNVIKRYQYGSMTSDKWSLPLALLYKESSSDDSMVKSIDKIFNGLGYIGSTVFALPGVKGLIPNGRNEDGSLNNKECTVSKVLTRTAWSADYSTYSEITITENGEIGINTHYLNESENYLYNIAGAIHKDRFVAGSISFSNTSPFKVLSFNAKTPFHALDWNDKKTISSWGMPSNKYIDLTLGATATQYTAPANGYFFCNKVAGATGKYIYIRNITSELAIEAEPVGSGNYARIFLPVKKGDIIEISYTLTGATNFFRFIYAEGEV